MVGGHRLVVPYSGRLPREAEDTGTSEGTGSETTSAMTMTSDSTTVTTTVSTSASTSDSTTVNPTDPDTTDATTTSESTDTGTTATSDTGTTDPDTSGGSDSGTTGAVACEPMNDPCFDCIVVDNCCAEFTACVADKPCACMLTCINEGGVPIECAGSCEVQAVPPALEPFFGCAQQAGCDKLCA